MVKFLKIPVIKKREIVMVKLLGIACDKTPGNVISYGQSLKNTCDLIEKV